jgi:hypothetical protein
MTNQGLWSWPCSNPYGIIKVTVLTGGSLDEVRLVLFGVSAKIDSPLCDKKVQKELDFFRKTVIETVSYSFDYTSAGHVHYDSSLDIF